MADQTVDEKDIVHLIRQALDKDVRTSYGDWDSDNIIYVDLTPHSYENHIIRIEVTQIIP